MSRRYKRGSIVLTTNGGFGNWGQVFPNGVVATAILDRLLRLWTLAGGKSLRGREAEAGRTT